MTSLQLRQTIITLTLTLTAASISFGQNFNKDIKHGLYLWSSGLVIQQISDTLKIFKLMESKRHYYKVANAVPDSYKLFGASQPIPIELYPISDTHKPTDILIKATKITDIIESGKSRFSIIFPNKEGFYSANFIKCDFGYEMNFSRHQVKKKAVIASVKRDTAVYFKLYAFTLDDLSNLKKLKDFNDIDEAESDALATVYQNCIDKNVKLMEGNKTFGIAFDGLESYGIVEGRELIIKSLIEQKYNPLIAPNDFDLIYEKLKPRLKPKR
jgi:hypothetical protein